VTALTLTARRFYASFAGLRIEALAFAALALVVFGAALVSLLPARDAANAATVTLPITQAKAAQLIDATSGDAASQMQAVGDQARVINAELPFAKGPVNAAHPFAITGNSTLDQRRALLCLTQAVYYEAGFEPLEGRRAVAQVVLNRMRHPAFPKSVCGVVYQNNGRICQFTFVCDGSLYRAPAIDAWRQAEQIARAALAGYVETRVGEATHYHADYVAPRWAPLLSKVAAIGQHIFYRWPGAWGQPAAFSGRYIGEPRDPLAMRPPPPAIAVTAAGDAVLTQAAAGPPIPRADTDVGGLLDTTKGWTLSIPGPEDSNSATARLLASQEHKPEAKSEPRSEPKIAAADIPAAIATR
jgi:spore germination cell wall hydrolase CwlJ-like protein